MKIISEGSFAAEAVGSFFVTFFTDKESKGGNPCGFQERVFLTFHYSVFYLVTLIYTPIEDDGSE